MKKKMFYKLKEVKILTGLVLFVFTFLSFSSLAYADFMFKPVKASLTIKESGYYNSNPGYACEDKNRYSQGGNKLETDLALEVPFLENHKYSLASSNSWTYYYSKHTYDNVTSNVVQALDLAFNKWLINVHHNFLNAYDPDTQELVTGYYIPRKFHKRVQYPGITIRGDLGKMKLTVDGEYQNYARTNTYYDDWLSRETYTGKVETAWTLTPLMDLFQSYRYSQTFRESSERNDSTNHEGLVGLRGRLTSYLTIEGAVGYSWLLFDDYNLTDKSDFKGCVYSGMINNTLTPLTTQNVTFSYSPQISYNVSNYYKTYLIGYNIAHKLNSRLNLRGGFSYGHGKEDAQSAMFAETCHAWKYTTGLCWNFFKNTDLICDYGYTTKSSDGHAKSFKQHTAQVGVAYNF